ncbi:MAG: DUF3793 family protein [Ruminococcus sp.]
MSKSEYCSFSQKLAFHTVPTLLGIKCASLISLSSAEFDIEFHLRYFNNKAAARGLRSKILCSCGSRTLMFVYSEKMLKNRLANEDVKDVLGEYGCPAMGAEVLEEDEFEPFFSAIEGSLNGKKVALFGSYGWGDGEWMRNWEERVKSDGAILVNGEGLIVNETPSDDDLEKCTNLGKALEE